MEQEYRTVKIVINTVMKNVSSKLTDEDCIDIIHNQLSQTFGLNIDRNQISIKEEN